MRVLHVAADLGTYGAERFVVLLLQRLREPDLDLGALTLAPARLGDAPEHVERLSANRRGRYDAAVVFRLAAAMRHWRPDVVHTHTHAGKYWGRLAAVLAGVPAIVHTEHNSEFGAPPAFRPLNALLLRRTDAVITFSEAQRERLVAQERVPLAKVAIIPNGIELAPADPGARARARAALGARDGDWLIVQVGRLGAVKNQAASIRALALLERGVRLVLIGEGPERAALEQLARDCGVADRTAFLGYRTDAAQLVAGADAVLVTSLNEAMPLAVIEALVAGAPVVCAPWRGAAEMLGDGAYGTLTPDFAPESFAAALRAVRADPAGARERAARGAAFARAEFDIATTARRHVALYREISVRSRSASRPITAPRS